MKGNRIYPKQLKQGDLVGLVAPSFPISETKLKRCIRALEALGLRVKVGETLQRTSRSFEKIEAGEELQPEEKKEVSEDLYGYLETAYLGGSPKKRAEDLNRMFADSEIKAVLCARGGYGSAQIMKYLDFELIRRNPKILAGFSDITNLLNGIGQKCNLVTYHAPMVASNMVDAEFDTYSRHSYEEALFSDWKEIIFRNPPDYPLKRLAGGKAEGELVGGNVTVFARMTGTFYQPDTAGKILFLEDVGESVASLDMYITQMDNAGVFDGIRGLLLGDFNDCENKYCSAYTVEDLLKDRFAERGIPVLAHLRSGHQRPMATLPIGAWCSMDADSGEIRFMK